MIQLRVMRCLWQYSESTSQAIFSHMKFLFTLLLEDDNGLSNTKLVVAASDFASGFPIGGTWYETFGPFLLCTWCNQNWTINSPALHPKIFVLRFPLPCCRLTAMTCGLQPLNHFAQPHIYYFYYQFRALSSAARKISDFCDNQSLLWQTCHLSTKAPQPNRFSLLDFFGDWSILFLHASAYYRIDSNLSPCTVDYTQHKALSFAIRYYWGLAVLRVFYPGVMLVGLLESSLLLPYFHNSATGDHSFSVSYFTLRDVLTLRTGPCQGIAFTPQPYYAFTTASLLLLHHQQIHVYNKTLRCSRNHTL